MKWITVVFSAASGLLLYMNYAAHRAVVKQEQILIHELPESFTGKTIFFISDIHRRKISKSLSRQIAEKADIIIIGGDLREKGVPFSRTDYNLRLLKKEVPMLFVWGNHDMQERSLELKSLLTAHQIEILDGDIFTWKIHNSKLCIAGLNETTGGADSRWMNAEILVSHYPSTAVEAAEHAKAYFMLTGHSHGGQIRFGPWGIRPPGGWKQACRLTYLVSCGYGTTLLPLRFGARAEAHFITLVSAEK